MISRPEMIFALHFCKYWFTSVWSVISVALFTISVNVKHFFMCLNSAVFKGFTCENGKLPVLCLKHPLFQHLHMNPKWTVKQHSQMVNIAEHALNSKLFSPLFTKAWKRLPGYFLCLLSINGWTDRQTESSTPTSCHAKRAMQGRRAFLAF